MLKKSFTILALLAVILAGCKDQEDSTPVKDYTPVTIKLNAGNDEVAASEGETHYVDYVIEGTLPPGAVVTASSDSRFAVKVIGGSTVREGRLKVTVLTSPADGYVKIMVGDIQGNTATKTIKFYQRVMTVGDEMTTHRVAAGGGEVEIPLTVNFDYTVAIATSNGDTSWITHAVTRAETREETLKLTLAENNTGEAREAIVSIVPEGSDTPCQQFTITQAAAHNPADDMILTVKPSVSGGTVTLPLAGQVDVIIDWGDGSDPEAKAATIDNTSAISHTYASYAADDTFQVTISGAVESLNAVDQVPYAQRASIVGLEQWGRLGLKSLKSAFYQTAITSVPTPQTSALAEVTSFGSAFSHCISLTSLPADLFSGCSSATDFSQAFQACLNLASLPAGLFSGCSSATNFEQAFNACTKLASLPDGLFSGCSGARDFSSAFAYCTNLSSLPADLFSGCSSAIDFTGAFHGCTNLASLPDGLFSGCPSATVFSYAFYECTNLISLPAGLFSSCANATHFVSVFEGCTNLASLPAGLFSSCASARNFNGAFYGCSALVTIPPSLFNNNRKVIAFSHCFFGCTAVAGESPYTEIGGVHVHLYERANYPGQFSVPTNYVACFCDASFSDAPSIPDAWK